ncbi:MAG: exodeoxyribonuclease VII large subunit [Magnetococcales bacterium]|nr:exodeoxyribonuclease VII large subunit [Magnetococcales bacterium]
MNRPPPPWPPTATRLPPLETTHTEGGMPPWEQWLTVSQLNEQIRDLLEGAWPFVRLQGEISDLHQPASGHLYFTLMDAQSRLRAVVWRSTRHRLRVLPRAGESVRVTGRIAAYPPRGEYQLVVEGMQTGGAGAERQRFLQLFARLKEEGLFDERRKRALPLLPETIGVVTSASGAVIHDIVTVLDSRFPHYHLLLAHAKVQGEGAAEEIVAALHLLRADGRAQVILCARGGGATEDLAAFNSEAVVRAIAASPVPVISAVGHEVDVTLADLVADLRAPTPSAAAERLLPEKNQLQEKLQILRHRLRRALWSRLEQQRQAVHAVQQRLLHPRRRLEFLRIRCDDLLQRLCAAQHHGLQRQRQRLESLQDRLSVWAEGTAVALFRSRLTQNRERLQQAGRHYLERKQAIHSRLQTRLHGVSPLAVLQRGYAIVYNQRGQVVRSAEELPTGERLRIRLAQGELIAILLPQKENPCSDTLS